MPKRVVEQESEITAILTVLTESPKDIARIVHGCTDDQLHGKPAPDAWSATEILAHLRACAEVWGRSIERMIAEDHPTIRYVSPRSWIRKTDFLDLSFQDSLRRFTEGRGRLVETLSALEWTHWSRGATFTGTKLGRDATVLVYAKRIADHEQAHLDQLRRTVGA